MMAPEAAKALAASYGGPPCHLPCLGFVVNAPGPVHVSISVVVTHSAAGDLLTADSCGRVGEGEGGGALYLTARRRSAAGFVVARGKALVAATLERAEDVEQLTDVQRALVAARTPIGVACVPVPAPAPAPEHGLDHCWPFAVNGVMGALMLTFPAGPKPTAGVIARATELARALAVPLARRARVVLEDLWSAGVLPLPPPLPLGEPEEEGDGEGGSGCDESPARRVTDLPPDSGWQLLAGASDGAPEVGASAQTGGSGGAAGERGRQGPPPAPGRGDSARSAGYRGPSLDSCPSADRPAQLQLHRPATAGLVLQDTEGQEGPGKAAASSSRPCSETPVPGLQQDPFLLTYKSPEIEREYMLWSNAGKIRTDCAFGLVFLAITLCLASLAAHHAAAPLLPLLWALALGRVAQLVALAAARQAYLRWREAFCCGLMLLQVWHCCAMLSDDLFGEPPPGTLRSFTFLARLTAAEPMLVLALGNTVRLNWLLPTSVASLGIMLAHLSATCAHVLPALSPWRCQLVAAGMAAAVGVAVPAAAVYVMERLSRSIFAKQVRHGSSAGAR